MSDKLGILQHALGLDQYGRGTKYRRYFVTGKGSDDYHTCRELVADGLMEDHGNHRITGGDTLFTVTAAGITFVAINSPKPPKLTAGQKRYREYLYSDGCGENFGDWLKRRMYEGGNRKTE